MKKIFRNFVLPLILILLIYYLISEHDMSKLIPIIGLLGTITGYLLSNLLIKASKVNTNN